MHDGTILSTVTSVNCDLRTSRESPSRDEQRRLPGTLNLLE